MPHELGRRTLLDWLKHSQGSMERLYEAYPDLDVRLKEGDPPPGDIFVDRLKELGLGSRAPTEEQRSRGEKNLARILNLLLPRTQEEGLLYLPGGTLANVGTKKIIESLKGLVKKFKPKPKTPPTADIPPIGTSAHDDLMQMMDDFLQQSQQNVQNIIGPVPSTPPALIAHDLENLGVFVNPPLPPTAIGVAKSIPKVVGIVAKVEKNVATMSYDDFSLISTGLVGKGYNIEKGMMTGPIVRVLKRPDRVLKEGKVIKGEEVTFSFTNKETGRRTVKIEEASKVPGESTTAELSYDLYDHEGKTYIQGFHFYAHGYGVHEQKARIMAGRLFQDFMKQVPEGAIFDSGSLTLDSLEFVLRQLVKMNKKGVKIVKHPTFPHITTSSASRFGPASEIARGSDRYINTLTGRKMNGKQFESWRRKKSDEVFELELSGIRGDMTQKESDALVNLIKSDLRNWEKQLFSKKDRIEELQKIFNDIQTKLLKQGKMSKLDKIDFKVIDDPSNVKKLKVEWPAFEIRDFKAFIPLALGYPSWKVMERELYGEKVKGSSS